MKYILQIKVDIIDSDRYFTPKIITVNPLNVKLLGEQSLRFKEGCCDKPEDVTAYFFQEGIRTFGVIGMTTDEAVAFITSDRDCI